MAKVRINGDTSGYIEISAPNVAGSTTITLPTTTGGSFLVTDSNGDLNIDSNTFYVDAVNNRVGVGTASPNSLLHVNGEARFGASEQLRLTAASTEAYIDAISSGGNLAFRTNGGAGAVERARIDSDGRLLVGTSTSVPTGSSTAGLQLHNTTTGNGAFLSVARFNNDAQGGKIALCKSRNTTVAAGTIVQANDIVGSIEFAADDGTDIATRAAEINVFVDGTPGANNMPGRLAFFTTPAGSATPVERMRMRENGSTSFYVDSDTYCNVRSAGSSTTSNAFGVFKSATSVNDGTLCMVIRQDGDLENTNNSYGSLSDIKLKENIFDASPQWDDIKALQVRKYNFKPETGYGTHTQIGLIAQEVELVSPGLVSESPDLDEDGNDLGTTTKSVNYSVLYMKAVKALQEAMERIEVLEQRLTDAGIA